MDIEKLRRIAASLPHTAETVQWGGNLVLWCADKAIGGKMFAIADLEPARGHVAGFAAGPEHYAELLEREGFRPAPHLARAHWIAVERWNAMTDAEWREELTAAHARIIEKLPRRTRAVLELPARERQKVVRERRATLMSTKR